MSGLPQNYEISSAEKIWQKYWNDKKTYAWKKDEPRENNFVIDTPPPTVSGLLHMGHIFSYTQADFIARYQRMLGKNVFYPMGFDDNGLPTERLVEKVRKIRATDMPREDFIKQCEEVTAEARAEFRRLFESVALSVDWEQEYHTISEHSRRMSQASFIDLFKNGHAYRKLQPMLWDPVDQTAIAQAEVEDKELPSFFNDIHFGLENSADKLTIATTRPEMISACVAVFYNPVDSRYTKLNGKFAITPIYNVKVPILADDKVEMEKGTGLVMCCTFGDETDIFWWQKHNLDMRIVLDKYGKLRTEAIIDEAKGTQFPELDGLKVVNAREKIIEKLKELNLLVDHKQITHTVKCAERSGAPLEILPTSQWFVKVTDKKEELKAKSSECNWHPQYMKIRMDQWIDGLNWDWCISRQRYFGVPFPIWYSKRSGEEGKILTADISSLPVNPMVDLPVGYSKDEVEPDVDVMDTWATSSISPQLSSYGISEDFCLDKDRHSKLFPADLRPQAHEIIRTWAFYTIVKAQLHQNTIPWKNLMISGWCLASDKTKMSKSKGNVVTPVELIENRGADVVRYWASTSNLGADTAFSEDVLNIGKKLVNKLFNAAKFVAIQLENLNLKPTTALEDVTSGKITEVLDLWVLTRLNRAISKSTEEFSKFEYCRARVAIEDFFWNDVCDNYFEMIKGRVYNAEEAKKQSAILTLHHILEAVLRLFAPIIPHITEELYSKIFPQNHAASGSIHSRGMWPTASDYPINERAEKIGIDTREILDLVRKFKSENNVSVKHPIKLLEISGVDTSISEVFEDLKAVTNSEMVEISFITKDSLSKDYINVKLTLLDN